MRTVLLASLRTHARRYVAALVAVTISVGFVVVTNALTSATKSGISAGVTTVYRGDLVIGDPYGLPGDDLDPVLEVARTHGDATNVIAETWQPVQAGDRSIGSDVHIGTVSSDEALRWQTVTEGRAPRTDSEALVSASTAKAKGLGLGDTLTLGEGTHALPVQVVGLAEGSPYLGADLYVPWPAMLTLADPMIDGIVYDIRSTDSVAARTSQLDDAVDADVQATAPYVDARVKQNNQGIDVIGYLLLLFAAIAGFVAVLVIANTFTILFAQRTRDLALLRCVGATRRQVLRSIRIESLVLAVVAATTGVIVGIVAGYGLAALVRVFAGAERIGAVALSPSWLIGGFGLGIVTTLVAAWWPTRTAVRVSPLAALRPAQTVGLGTPAGRVRIALGVLTILAGAALLVLAIGSAHAMPIMLVGGMSSFVGVLLLGPVIVPALLRLLGHVFGARSMPFRIAAANAIRHPRRSATTTAALLIGVTLAAAVLTGLASGRDAIGSEMDADHPVDAALTGTTPITARTLEQVKATDGVRSAVSVSGTVATADNMEPVAVLGPDVSALDLTRDPDAVQAAHGEVVVPVAAADVFGGEIPETLTLQVDDRSTTLTTRVTSSGWGRALIVSPTTLRELVEEPQPMAVWASVSDGTNADDLGGDLGLIGTDAGLDLTNAIEDRAWVQLQLDVLTWAVLGMLGVGAAIALVGIANTVGLSVLERGREHALLRALGLTRKQLRQVLAAEGLLLTLVAALLGVAIGTAYGWVGTITIVRAAVPDAQIVIPWLQLLAVTVVAAAAGILACALPARRAARIAPAEGLAVE